VRHTHAAAALVLLVSHAGGVAGMVWPKEDGFPCSASKLESRFTIDPRRHRHDRMLRTPRN